jgi:glycosyltransferase involved in cell wall biosynthesis
LSEIGNGVFSLILPIYNQADHIEKIVGEMARELDSLPIGWEILLVPNGCRDGSEDICRSLSREEARILSFVSPKAGWGNAVRYGLQKSRGDTLCFTNSARTAAGALRESISKYLDEQPCVLKVKRAVRDSIFRKLGSLLYNAENYMLFGINVSDINGTPKIFPRSYAALLDMKEEGDLLDLEFNVICKRNRYRVIEPSVVSTTRHGGKSTTKLSSAWRMYCGSVRLWKELRQREKRY